MNHDPTPHWVLNRRLFWVTIALSIATILSFALATWSFYEAHNANRERVEVLTAIDREVSKRAAFDRLILCRAENRSTKAIDSVLMLGLRLAKHDPNITEGERKVKMTFYTESLSLTVTLDCARLHK